MVQCHVAVAVASSNRRVLAAAKATGAGAVGVVVLCCGFGYLVAGIVAGMIAGMVAEMGIAGECPHVVYPFAAESVI